MPATPETKTEITNKVEVELRRPDGLTHNRVYGFSVNFCDKTTWFADAVKVTEEEVGPADGVQTVFQLAHGSNQDADERIVDLNSGKVSEENDIANPDGKFRTVGGGFTDDGPLSGYVPIVTVADAEKTERGVYESSGGDYQINYHTGEVTFFTAPANGASVKVTYFYVPPNGCGCVVVVPDTGRKAVIDRVEVQCTDDVVMNDTIVMNVYAGAAPPNGSPVRRPTYVKNLFDLINWAAGSYSVIPPHGGSPRGTDQNVIIHRVEYMSEIPLLASQLIYIRVHLENAKEFGGTWATVVIYGFDEAEG